MMPGITGKVWGISQEILANGNFEVHRISVNQGGYCSKHCHEHKYNAFFVESGELKIKVWKNDYDLCDETIVTAGNLCIVKPLEYHQFEALQDTVAYEIYWVELRSDDIVRENHGGVS